MIGCVAPAVRDLPALKYRAFDVRRRDALRHQRVMDPERIPDSCPWVSCRIEVKPSTISTAQLHRLPDFHMPPIEQVISLRSYPVDPVGNLISRRASHLDAFSAYPDRT